MGNCFSCGDPPDDVAPAQLLDVNDADRRARAPQQAIVGSADAEAGPSSAPSSSERSSTRRLDKGKGKEKDKDKERVTGRLSLSVGRDSSFRRRKSSTANDLIEMSWRSALRSYATVADPAHSIAPSVLLSSNQNTIAIFDAFPKAKYHFLVLPRFPFSTQEQYTGKRSAVPLTALDSLKSLMTSTSLDEQREVIAAMEHMANEVEEMIRDEMVKTEGFEWGIDMGFHAVPSMLHLHLHVISDDRLGPALKHKGHYNSFRTDLGFFVTLSEVKRWLESEEETRRLAVENLNSVSEFLRSPLECQKCDEVFENLPKLRAHLEKEFEQARRKKAKLKDEGSG